MNALIKTSVTCPFTLKDEKLWRTECYLDATWRSAASGRTFEVRNPADGTLLAKVPEMSADETVAAIAAAEAARPAWQALTGKARGQILRRWFDLIMANSDDLAQILSAENGKPLPEARGEIAYGASFVEWFAEEAKRVYGDVIPSPMGNTRLMVIKQPIGVVAAITPWNFPCAMITRKVAPGLAAGCTYVLKPAEQTPLSALALAELAHRAGIPRGVLNVITGDGPTIGKVMCTSEVVRKVTFTGSTEVGRILMRQSADTIKKLSLELGGNAPYIVFDDADLNAAADGLIASKFRNAGQTCVCPNRVYVQAGVYDEFAAKVRERMLKLKVGKASEAGVTIGPLIDAQGLAKVQAHVTDAISKGAMVALGGKPHELGGLFYQPTLLMGVTKEMIIAREETFGPVAPLFKFETEQDVIAMANDSEFGLAAYFYSRDVARCFRVAERIESGMVGVNTGVLGNEMSPFGGVKQSGLGREGSKYGIEDFLEIKYVAMGSITG
jgi:succinate-semialdehyde dehydrogenase / glutarate-semialdehyde dehydrogenase